MLVPRPETEALVEWALEVAPSGAAVLDWGSGSGAVALALADEGDGLRVTGRTAPRRPWRRRAATEPAWGWRWSGCARTASPRSPGAASR